MIEFSDRKIRLGVVYSFASLQTPDPKKVFFPNQACLWGSYKNERISVRIKLEGGSPVTQDRVPPKILVPGSWYQEFWKFGNQKIQKSMVNL